MFGLMIYNRLKTYLKSYSSMYRSKKYDENVTSNRISSQCGSVSPLAPVVWQKFLLAAMTKKYAVKKKICLGHPNPKIGTEIE